MFVDIHSHLLPGLDDGARSVAEAAQMAAGLADLGFSEVWATPHQRAGAWTPGPAEIAAAAFELRAARAGRPPAVRIGAENYWDDLFFHRLRAGSVPGYEGTPAFLVEFPPENVPPRVEDHLYELRLQGRLPVLAHPERYRALAEDAERCERVARVALLVVDLGALAGLLPGAGGRAARRMLLAGHARAAASDLHQPASLGRVAAGIAWIRKRMGPERLKRLLADAPRAALAGEMPE